MRIDAHQHFWRYSPSEYPWMTDRLAALRRDYLPADLGPLLTEAGLDGSIAVQARQTLAESRWLLELAAESPGILGVVGWVDLQSDRLDDDLRSLCAHPKLVGVRHVVQDEPDDRFLLTPDFLRGIRRLPAFGLTYDLLIYPHQLAAALEFALRLPDVPIVVDHLAKPVIRDGTRSPWREHMQAMARLPNVHCKVSGLVTEARWDAWRPDELRPYLDVVFEAFGEDRLLFGSDWPVCLLAARYDAVYAVVDHYTRPLGDAACAKIFGGNAARFYGIGDAKP